MIQVRVRAFHLDHMPKCEHGRVSCRACGLDPFNQPSAHLSHPQHTAASGKGFVFNHGSAIA